MCLCVNSATVKRGATILTETFCCGMMEPEEEEEEFEEVSDGERTSSNSF